ncbi:MAG: FkbM family methyltransferase [Ferruginibacter sp.]
MNKYYSQHGEDFILNKIFKNKKKGFFVEIGCLDGIEFSNSYFFEKKGWNGICLEAHNDFIGALKKNRPGSQIVHCAVGEKNMDEVIFYANRIGSLSTLDKSQEERWVKNYREYFDGFVEQKVQMRTLNSVFKELQVTKIDFISLDIEGYEIEALQGLDLEKFKPNIFVIEYKDDDHKKGLEEILFKNGYFFIGLLGCNLFYGVQYEDRKYLNKNYGKIKLSWIDMNGVETIKQTIFNFNKNTNLIKLKNIIKKTIVERIIKRIKN